MANIGQSLNNPCTRERIVFQQTEQDTGGALVEFDHYMPLARHPRSPNTFNSTRKNGSRSCWVRRVIASMEPSTKLTQVRQW